VVHLDRYQTTLAVNTINVYDVALNGVSMISFLGFVNDFVFIPVWVLKQWYKCVNK